MGSRLTHDQFLQKLKLKQSNIIVLSKYTYSDKYIQVQCNRCNHIWRVLPRNLLTGTGCPNCAITKKLSHDQFLERMLRLNPNIKILGRYINMKTKILAKCLICSTEWLVAPSKLSIGRGCPTCAWKDRSNKWRLSHEEFIKNMKKKNSKIKVISKYKKMTASIDVKCTICNFVWSPRAQDIYYRGNGCPRCRISKGERSVEDWLVENNIEFEVQKRFKDCKDQRILPFDFYIESLNTCIEYQGEQHYRKKKWNWKFDLNYIQRHDKIKKDYCNKNNIRLLEITYKDEPYEKLTKYFRIGGVL